MEATAKHFRKRDAILNCLRNTDVHPSAEWVYEQLKAEHSYISLATVYRNLALFKTQGIINSLGTVKGVERFDGNTCPHVHFVCNGCDAVVDLPEVQVPASLSNSVEKSAGCRVEACQLTFTGTCEQCKSKNVEDKLICTNYRYSDYFEDYIKEDNVKFKCRECGYEWIEVF